MDKANYYSSMIHKPGLKIVSLPMYIASYNMIDIEYAESFQRHRLLYISGFPKYTGLVSNEN